MPSNISRQIRVRAKDILFKCNRFDLIFKYLYLSHRDQPGIHDFHTKLYLAHIRAFNNFHEKEPRKSSAEDFILHFEKTFASIKRNGFIEDDGVIAITDKNDLFDGAHRLVSSAYLDLELLAEVTTSHAPYDYQFFLNRGLEDWIADFGALEFLKLSPFSYVVNVHSIVPLELDSEIESILSCAGKIFYKKNIGLSFNGYVNLKKLTYGASDGNETWIGSPSDNYRGAKDHANSSFGEHPLRFYILLSDSIENIISAKEQVRSLCKTGNYSIHTNDTREEAIHLGQALLNNNSIFLLNNRPYEFDTKKLDLLAAKLIALICSSKLDRDLVCVGGSSPLAAFGIRNADDLDYLNCNNVELLDSTDISSHESELEHYPFSQYEIACNPLLHFYYRGLKFITLDVLLLFKNARNETPKDIEDIFSIMRYRYSLEQFASRNRTLWLHSDNEPSPFFKFAGKLRNRVSRVWQRMGA
jgi:hypothetical protein